MKVTLYALILGDDVIEERSINLGVVSSLLKIKTIYLARLNISRDVVGINLSNLLINLKFQLYHIFEI